MNIAIVTPEVPPSLLGNSVDADRWKKGLEKKGKTARLFLSSDQKLIAKLNRFKPDLAHVLHASKGARAIRHLKKHNVPVVLTISGTDVNLHLDDKNKRKSVVDALHLADRIIVFYNRLKVRLAQHYPRLKSKFNVINKEIQLEKSSLDFRKKYKYDKEDFLFYLPGPLKRIKNVLFPVESMIKLHELYPNVRYVVSGPVVDRSIANKLSTLHKKHKFIKYIKTVPRKDMYAAYQAADVILNCSESEGMPTAILESMMLGKAVLAHKIEPTEAIIQHNTNGLLYKNEPKFYQLAERLVCSKRLKGRLEKNAYETYRFFYSNKQEVQRIIGVYDVAMGNAE